MEKDEDMVVTPATIDNDLQSILSSFQDEPSIYGFDYPPSDSTFQSPITSPSSSFSHRLASPLPNFPNNRPVRFYTTFPSNITFTNSFQSTSKISYIRTISFTSTTARVCFSITTITTNICSRCFRYSNACALQSSCK